MHCTIICKYYNNSKYNVNATQITVMCSSEWQANISHAQGASQVLWLLSSRLSQWVCVYPLWHAPLYRVCDWTGALECLKCHGAVRGSQMGIHGHRACADVPKWPAKGGRCNIWERHLRMLFKTGTEHKYVWDTFSYELNSIQHTYI